MKVNKKYQKVRYEFYNFSGNGVLTGRSYTLKIESPAQITFTALGGPVGAVIINKDLVLNCYRMQTLGTATGPSQITLSNNVNEIDITTYQIICSADAICNVVCKYYVNE